MPDLHVDLHDISKLQNIDWSLLCLYDVVFLQRPWNNIAIVKYLKELKIPVWIDYDDLLFQIPRANRRAYGTYMNEQIHNTLTEIAKNADIISVSTSSLKMFYDQLNKNVRIVPNALNFELIGPEQQGKTEKVMLWRGGDSHQQDFDTYKEEIITRQLSYQDWVFTYAGTDFYDAATPNSIFLGPKDPTIYFSWLKTAANRAMQVPLHDCFFNHCKSNIAALEGTFGGAVCIVPDWEEWQIPGTLKYKTVEEYGEKMDIVLKEQISFNKYRGQAMEYIREFYSLDKVNNLRVQILRELADR